MKRWKDLFTKTKSPQKLQSYRYVILVLIVGVALMLFGSFQSKDSGETKAVKTAVTPADGSESVIGKKNEASPSTPIEYEHYYEQQLEEAIEDVYGVTDVTVTVYIATSETKIVEKNVDGSTKSTSETDQKGGSREIKENSEQKDAVIIDGQEGEKPLVIGTEQPKISGVLVVAGGADNAQVKLWIKNAVNSLLGIPDYRIAVLPKKQRGNEQ
ncbi:MAG TPA: stage III sporulation protein AG [Bacillales bacterium]|nr:stage III sporulation protein AG [Bacillales bacterium]